MHLDHLPNSDPSSRPSSGSGLGSQRSCKAEEWLVYGWRLAEALIDQNMCEWLQGWAPTIVINWSYSHKKDASENSGTPKSSILRGFPIINHAFWGTSIFETPISEAPPSTWWRAHLVGIERFWPEMGLVGWRFHRFFWIPTCDTVKCQTGKRKSTRDTKDLSSPHKNHGNPIAQSHPKIPKQKRCSMKDVSPPLSLNKALYSELIFGMGVGQGSNSHGKETLLADHRHSF